MYFIKIELYYMNEVKVKYSRTTEEPLKLQSSSFSKNVFGNHYTKLISTKLPVPARAQIFTQ